MSGWQTLGNVLGGGIDRQGAYDDGRLRTAKTEDAIITARTKQLEYTTKEAQKRAQDAMDTTLAEAGVPNPKLAAGVMRAGYGNFQQTTAGLGNLQMQDFRSRAADPTLDQRARNVLLAAIQGKPVADLEAIGPGGVTNIMAPTAELFTTPLGQSMIDENEASAYSSLMLGQRREAERLNPERFRAPSAAATGLPGPGGINLNKPPAGYVVNPNFDPTKPVGDGNYPYIDGRRPEMGSRETAMANRVFGSAAAVAKDMSNLSKMPFETTNVGLLGVGEAAGPQVSLLNAVAGNLKYKIAPQAVRNYNVFLGGMNRALSFIEGQGLQGSNALANSYDTLTLRPGDTIEDVMIKLAQTRQTVEQGLVPHIDSPRVPPETRKVLRDTLADLERAVPWTVEDVIALSYPQNEGATIMEAAQARKAKGPAGGGRGAAPAAPAAAPAAGGALPERNAKGWQLMEDAAGNRAYVGPNNEVEEVR